ncbi:MAG: hypothetical protein LQ346_006986 [Caloplaca aetnensis]|nr:MAG: hypothetical protein LQ346_006986 [Caloplaca aetnensis]
MDVTDIADKSDLIVEVTETLDNGTSKTARFGVSKAVLTKVSSVFLGMLVGAHWKERSQSLISLGDGHLTVTEVWLRVMHETSLMYNLLFPDLWHLVQAIDYYDLEVTAFNDWFATWYQKANSIVLKPAELLYPTWRFDHAKGFARWTRFMAYNHTGHITEKNPTKLIHYHLPSRLIQQLNAAKGRLRTVLFRGLWAPCHRLLHSGCACRKETLYDYQEHLYTIDVWPLETVFLHKSINEILENLTRFSYEAPARACVLCRQDYKKIVKGVEQNVRSYFDGLCLDCLDRSKPKTEDIDMDYWRHHELKEHEWTSGCRFSHKQPTWYFSFNGRKEERDRMAKKMQGSRPRNGRYRTSPRSDSGHGGSDEET